MSRLVVGVDLELAEFRDHVFGRRRGLDGLVDRRDVPVLADVERPAVREAALREHAVGVGRFLGRVAQQREVGLLGFGELVFSSSGSTLAMK